MMPVFFVRQNTRFALHSVCSATEEMPDVLQWFIDAGVNVNSITMVKFPVLFVCQ